MAVLYLTEQGACLKKTGDRLIVEKDGTQLLELESNRLEAVFIFGNIQFSTQAVAELLEHNIELALLSMDGRLKGQLTPPLGKNIILRKKQYELSEDQNFCIKQAKHIVKVKIENQLHILNEADWKNAELELIQSRDELKRTIKDIPSAQTLESLLGIEGNAAKLYFSAFKQLVKDESLGFSGRNRRPPKDPVNAVISFGYVLLASRLQSLLDARGFDPYLGFFHKPDYGRPSLALDLLEPYRPLFVDRLAVKLFNLKILKSEDFSQQPDGGVRLSKEAMKKFFAQWEKHLKDWKIKDAMKEQIESLARTIKGEQEFPNHFEPKG